jgi:hypothetical protein
MPEHVVRVGSITEAGPSHLGRRYVVGVFVDGQYGTLRAMAGHLGWYSVTIAEPFVSSDLWRYLTELGGGKVSRELAEQICIAVVSALIAHRRHPCPTPSPKPNRSLN